MGKKKKQNPTSQGTESEVMLRNIELGDEIAASGSTAGTSTITSAPEQSASEPTKSDERLPSFKNQKWTGVGKFISGNKRSRVWKGLKQICTSEKVQLGLDTPSYATLDCPASTRCAKKYSDISGLLSKYIDPETKLRYTNAKEFRKIRSMPPDVVQGYLGLRRANNLGQ